MVGMFLLGFAVAAEPVKLPIAAPTVPIAGRVPLRHFAGFADEASAKAFAEGCDPTKAGTPFVVVVTAAGVGVAGEALAPWSGPDDVPAALATTFAAHVAGDRAAGACRPRDGGLSVLVAADGDAPYGRLRAVAAAAKAAGFAELGLLVHADAIAPAPVAPALGAKYAAVGSTDGWRLLPVDEPPPSNPELLPNASMLGYRARTIADPRRPFVVAPHASASLTDVAGVWSAVAPVSACVWLGLDAPAAFEPGAAPAKPGQEKLEREVSVLLARFPTP